MSGSDDRLDALRYHVNCRSSTDIVEPEKEPETIDIVYWCDRCGVRRPVPLHAVLRPWDIEKTIRCYGECGKKTPHWAEIGYPEWDPIRLEYRCTDCDYETVFYEEPGDRVANIPCEQCPTEGSGDYVIEASGKKFRGETVVHAIGDWFAWLKEFNDRDRKQLVSAEVLKDIRACMEARGHAVAVASNCSSGAKHVSLWGCKLLTTNRTDHPEVAIRVAPDVGALFLTKSVHSWEIEEGR